MIETERLVLRPHNLEDFDTLHAIWSDADVVRHISGKPSTRSESWSRLHRYAGHWSLLGYGYFAVTLKTTGAYFGDVGMARFERGLGADFDAFDEAGWVLASDSHGKGYATEAVTAVHDWYRNMFGLRRTVCIVSPANHGSVRVAEKAGYRPFTDRIFPGTDETVTLFERLG